MKIYFHYMSMLMLVGDGESWITIIFKRQLFGTFYHMSMFIFFQW